MRKLISICLALAILSFGVAVAQDTMSHDSMNKDTMKADASKKAIKITGKISDDGKTFVDKDNKSWTVTSPEALKGHEGHEVTLKAHLDAAKSEIHVVSVKMGKDEMKETKNKDEMKY